MALKIGDEILEGKYRILDLIDEGAFGKVYLADDVPLRRQVAIKELRREDWTDEQYIAFRRRFQREARIGAALRHENVVEVYTLEPSGEDFYLVMEYVDGPSLQKSLEGQGPLPIEEAVQIAMQLCEGLAAVHDHPLGIVHRDIKPSNILLTSQGQPKITDFGLAQLSAESGRSLGKGERHPGTPLYMSPEQEASTGYLRPASDIYSLACVLFEMLTGKIYKRVEDTRASEWRPDIPEWLDELLAKMLAKDRGSRYQEATEVKAHLEEGRRPELERQKELDSLFRGAGKALGAKEWPQAIRLAEEGLELEPGHISFESLLAQGKEAQAREIERVRKEQDRKRRERRERPKEIAAALTGIVRRIGMAGTVAGVVTVCLAVAGIGWWLWLRPTPAPRPVAVGSATATAVTPNSTGTWSTPTVVPRIPIPTAAPPSATRALTPMPPTATPIPPTLTPTFTPMPPTPTPRLTATAAQAQETWSPPHEEHIAFVSERDGNPEIYIMNADGSGQTRVTNNPATDKFPALSPDGTRIAFVRDDQIYVVNADGGGETNITPYPAVHEDPFWSPDGQGVFFTSDRDELDRDQERGYRPEWALYMVNADGTGLTRLTDNPFKTRSPDGTRMAFMCSGNGNLDICVSNANGSGLTRLTYHPYSDIYPAWSPDGAYIAFVRNNRPEEGGCYPGCNCEIYVISVDGSGETNLTNHPAVDQQPRWMRDGRRIVFVSERDGNSEIYIMNADGTNQTNLTRSPAPDYLMSEYGW